MTAPVKSSVRPDGKFWGVCSNLSRATGIDALWIRIAFVAGASSASAPPPLSTSPSL